MKLTDAQLAALGELKALRGTSGRNEHKNRDMPAGGLWWMPRGYRSIAHGTIKALHAKGLIEMHSNQYNRYDWCRINANGLDAIKDTT